MLAGVRGPTVLTHIVQEELLKQLLKRITDLESETLGMAEKVENLEKEKQQILDKLNLKNFNPSDWQIDY